MLLEDSEGYLMGPPGSRLLKRTHSLFIDDLKVYQQNHETLKMVNDMIVKASLDTGACYGVKKCAEIVFTRGKMVKGEGLEVLEERMKALDPESNESYKFLGCEQAEKISTDIIFKRVKDEVERRMTQLTTQELHERNLIKAINTRVIPVAGYVINVCDFTKKQLDEIDKTIKQELRSKNMHGRQASDERLYMGRKYGGRGVKCIKDVYDDTKVRVACYMVHSSSEWIKASWRNEMRKEGKSLRSTATEILSGYDIRVEFREYGVAIEGEYLDGTWKDVWSKLKTKMRKSREQHRKRQYEEKRMQSEIYKGLDDDGHEWLQCNIDPRKVSAIINMQEQMVETRAWKKNRGLHVDTEKCRLCRNQAEGVMHLTSGCQYLAANEYLTRHNNLLKILMVAWSKEHNLIDTEQSWYKVRWERGMVLENESVKMCWDFEYKMRKETTARRPDVTIEYKAGRLIQIVDMACPSESRIQEKLREKLQKYQQLAFEIRERRPGYKVEVLPVVVGCMGGGALRLKEQVKRIVSNEKVVESVWREMVKTLLSESESIIRKVLSNLITVE
jgi:hypothetical protein